MKSRKKMTKEQRDLVIELYVRGEKMEFIQIAVGKNRASIQRFLAKAEVPRRPTGYNRSTRTEFGHEHLRPNP